MGAQGNSEISYSLQSKTYSLFLPNVDELF